MSFDPCAYSIQVRRTRVDDEVLFVGTVLELPHIRVYEDTQQSAYEGVIEVIEGLYEDAQASGKTFPQPATEEQHSGRMTLRMSPDLHGRLDAKAQRDGLSQNATVVALIAAGLAAEETANALVERCSAAMVEIVKREIGRAAIGRVERRTAGVRIDTAFDFKEGIEMFKSEPPWTFKQQ